MPEKVPIESYKVKGCPFCGKKPEMDKSKSTPETTISCVKKNSHAAIVSAATEFDTVAQWNDQIISAPTYELKSITGIL